MTIFQSRRSKKIDPVYQEKLRQAKWSFNVAIGLTITSTGISLLGAALILFGKGSPGSTTAIGGIAGNIVSASYLQLAKEASKRLDED